MSTSDEGRSDPEYAHARLQIYWHMVLLRKVECEMRHSQPHRLDEWLRSVPYHHELSSFIRHEGRVDRAAPILSNIKHPWPTILITTESHCWKPHTPDLSKPPSIHKMHLSALLSSLSLIHI